jgi:hypothetical protein
VLKGQTKLVKAGANSLTRTSQDRVQVARSLSNSETNKKLNQVVRPNSISGTLKKAGLVVLLSPDPLGPIIDIPGVVLLGASYAMKKREPASIKSVFKETQLMLDELRSLL